MVFVRLLAVLGVCFLCSAMTVPAQEAEDLRTDAGMAAVRASDAVHQLSKELSLARKAGDGKRTRELERALFTELPALPEGITPLLGRGDEEFRPEEATGPLWGNDVRIYTGPVWSNGKRQLAIDADTVRGIYVAVNAKYQDTLSQILVYRSTNEGRNWTYLSRFVSSYYPIQSFDMCVTDTLGGKWLLGFAFVLKTDKTTAGGGHLYWGSVLNDGTDWRYTVIASATSTINFKNPSICTDGTNYLPKDTYHYIAAEYLNPTTDLSRGLFITRSTNWGKNWVAPDTSIKGFYEGTPVIAIDWSSAPDSLCLAFTRFQPGTREIRIGRNAFTGSGGWALNGLVTTTDDFDPSMAIDPVRGNAIITYTRSSGAPKYNDAMYLYSTDLFKTYKRDSIAASTAFEELTSVNFAPAGGTSYYWRVVYRSTAGNDTIYYKSVLNSMTGFYTAKPIVVSDFRPTATVMPAVGFDRETGANNYLGNCIYVGYGATNLYFDAVDLYLDVPPEEGIPVHYALEQNYPNPFNPATSIRYQIAGVTEVRLAVFDQLGREVARLVNEQKQPGSYIVRFDGARLASGMYFYRMEAGGYVETRKLLLLK
jgi:hypothetical protein